MTDMTISALAYPISTSYTEFIAEEVLSRAPARETIIPPAFPSSQSAREVVAKFEALADDVAQTTHRLLQQRPSSPIWSDPGQVEEDLVLSMPRGPTKRRTARIRKVPWSKRMAAPSEAEQALLDLGDLTDDR
jgi:hypothetical protein